MCSFAWFQGCSREFFQRSNQTTMMPLLSRWKQKIVPFCCLDGFVCTVDVVVNWLIWGSGDALPVRKVDMLDCYQAL